VFREVPKLGQLFIMRLLFVEQPIPKAVTTSWVDTTHAKEVTEVAESLIELRVWHEEQLPGGLPGWVLSHVFRKNMRVCLLDRGVSQGLCQCTSPDPNRRSVEQLDVYALERWECVLHYMVGSSQQEGIAVDAARILLHSGLMKTEEDDPTPVITRQGFQFLLMETGAQVWYFLLQYLDTCHHHQLRQQDCLQFLLQLGFSKLGNDYVTEGMSSKQLLFLQHLREFGLVYQRKRSSGRFYPTRLALDLSTGSRRRALAAQARGYLVVETNYRVYAYGASDLQVALVGLFCQMVYRFPNLSVAILTRDSVRQALRSGITADQIISFLRMHAHPEMKRREAVLPATVVDQIKLWELERDRFRFADGVLYSQFLAQADFEMLRNYARDLDVLSWESAEKRVMVVTRQGHDEVKRYWKRYGRGGV